MFVGMRRENNLSAVWVTGEGKEVVDTSAQSPRPVPAPGSDVRVKQSLLRLREPVPYCCSECVVLSAVTTLI